MKCKSIILCLLVLLCATLSVSAQKVEKRYVSRPTEKGMLYHIIPMELFRSATDKTTVKMDFTRLSTVDSMSVSYTILSERPMNFDKVSFAKGNRIFSYPVSKLFIESSKKSKWAHRYTFSLPLDEFDEIFCGDDIVSFQVWERDDIYEYYPVKKWNKESAVLEKILMLMRLN